MRNTIRNYTYASTNDDRQMYVFPRLRAAQSFATAPYRGTPAITPSGRSLKSLSRRRWDVD